MNTNYQHLNSVLVHSIVWSIDYCWLWMTNCFKWTKLDNYNNNVKWWTFNNILIDFYFSIDPASYKQEPRYHHHQQKDEAPGQHYKQPLRSLPLDNNTPGLGHQYPEPGVNIKTEQPDYTKQYNNFSNR